jgi:hypothetical protein
MRAAGVRHIDGAIEFLELAEPRALRADEILLDVCACGVGNWEVRPYPLERAGAAMAQVRHGAHGAAMVLQA